MFGLFCRRGKKGAKGNIIRPGLPGVHRKMAAVMARHANLRLPPEHSAGVLDGPVFLPDVNAVRAEPFGKRDAVVDDEGHLPFGANPLQRSRRARNAVLIYSLETQLKRRDRASVECLGELIRKAGIDGGRRDKIKLARGPILIRLEALREVRIEPDLFVLPLNHLTPVSGSGDRRDLLGGSCVNLVDRFTQCLVEFGIAHLIAEIFE